MCLAETPSRYIRWTVHGSSFSATALLNELSIIHFELFLENSELFLGLHIPAADLAQSRIFISFVSPSIFFLIQHHFCSLPFRVLCMESIALWLFLQICSISLFFSANILSASLLTSTFIWNWTPIGLDSSYALWFSCQGTLYNRL